MVSPPQRQSRTDATVSGAVVRTIPVAVERACGERFVERASDILAAHGLAEPAPTETYPLEDYLAAIDTLRDDAGAYTVERVARARPRVVAWPDGVDALEQALHALDGVHQDRHGGDVGHYTFSTTGPDTGRLVCRTPYPSDYERGLLRGLAKRFTATGYVGRTLVEERREAGRTVATFEVEWWDPVPVTDPVSTPTADVGRSGAD